MVIFRTTRFEVHLGAQEIYDATEEGRVLITTSDSLIYSDPVARAGFIEVDMALIRLPTPVTFSQCMLLMNSLKHYFIFISNTEYNKEYF